jgi:hypothetical protein
VTGQDDDLDAACRLGEHRYCSGNIDLQYGEAPPMPLTRCACSCHRGAVKTRVLGGVRHPGDE